MSNLKVQNIDFGKVRENQTVSAVYEILENGSKIVSASFGCGCVSEKLTDTSLSVRYNVGSIPYHLNNESFFFKEGTILFSNGTTEKVTFNGKIVKQL